VATQFEQFLAGRWIPNDDEAIVCSTGESKQWERTKERRPSQKTKYEDEKKLRNEPVTSRTTETHLVSSSTIRLRIMSVWPIRSWIALYGLSCRMGISSLWLGWLFPILCDRR
jgi:hypothetical protein